MARHETPDVKDRMEHLAFSAVLAGLRAGSRASALRRGEALGRFLARRVPLRREVALENLRLAFPTGTEAEHRATYERMFEQLGRVLAEFARFGRRDPEPVSSFFDLQGRDHVASALEGGRGALLLTAHFGNWEAFGSAMAGAGVPVTVLGARQRNPLVEETFSRLRRRGGMGTLVVGQSLRPVVELLEHNACLATLADQDGGPQGFFLDFLGRKASVQSGLFRLAARRGLPIVIGFAGRHGDGWRNELDSPLFPEPRRDPREVEKEARRLALLYTRRVETVVRARPDHWFWVHRRWKTRPPSEG
jgi:KDO2-lipid IV(A) lauroyltransferase